jgi:hypothetical protein
MKNQIIKIIGDNHTESLELLLANDNEPYGLYTFKGDVFVLKNGFDIPYDELTLPEQKKVFNQIKSNNFKLNNSLQ